MTTFRKIAVLLSLIAVFALAVVPAFAQETRTVTVTEEQANEAYWVTNPPRRSVSNIDVDYQPDQVVVTADVTLRRQPTVAVVATLTPSISNGRVYWTVSAVDANGSPVSDTLLAQINAVITSSWRNYIRENAKTGHVTAVEITDSDFIITFGPRQ